jgi:Regulator of ribonuclease activity B
MVTFSRETIEGVFRDVRSKTDWPIDDGECLWGYFFTDHNRKALEAAGRSLEAQGYRFVSIWDVEEGDELDDDGEPRPFYLHVERVESHSVDSLMTRNQQLTEFAQKNGLLSYDGMDVGAVPSD